MGSSKKRRGAVAKLVTKKTLSDREIIIRLAANALCTSLNNVSESTSISWDQCREIGMKFAIHTGKSLILRNFRGTVGDIIRAAQN